MAISFEWDKKQEQQDVLVARKSRGKISIRELQEALSADYRYRGGWAIIVVAREDRGYQGWSDIDEPKGDAIELYRIEDWATCPICAAVYEGVQYCPHCGERLREE